MRDTMAVISTMHTDEVMMAMVFSSSDIDMDSDDTVSSAKGTYVRTYTRKCTVSSDLCQSKV